MRRWSALLLVAALVPLNLVAQSAQPVPSTENPFFVEWTTPFGVPPFDLIREEHFLPAYDRAIAERKAEIDVIVAQADPPSFANTVEALDRSGELLITVEAVLQNLNAAETNETIQGIARDVAPRLAALEDDLVLNQGLFERVKMVWQGRDRLELTPEQSRLLEKTYRRFVRGGAGLAAADKERLRAVNAELAVLGLRFSENLLAETNGYRLVVDKEADLAGLPPSAISGAAEAAAAAGLDGKWVFTLQSPSIWPFLSYADNRELRRQILTAYVNRGNNGHERDNNQILAQIARLRAERAKLLGYPTHAHFVLEENMAKTPVEVYALLWQLWKPALAVASKEAEALQAMITQEGGDFELEPWDWRYYTEKVRQARYDVDAEAVRPYFQLDNVLKGAFWVANRLWGVTFVEREDIPTYHPEVRTFEVKDGDGSHVGVLLVDYYPRPGKRGGAWMSPYREQFMEDGHDFRPVIVNVGNFSRPTGDMPSLLQLEEAETMFHEFGHALHGLLSRCHYRTLAGTSVARDFVELPSQIMENWVLEPEVLKVYAKHYKTGEVIPPELVERILASQRFNQGFASVEYLAACFLDMDWHTLVAPANADPALYERQSLARVNLMPEIVVRYRSPYFNHIFGGDGSYSSGYYSYIWSEVLDADAYAAFTEKGIFDPMTARAFRTNILERGGSEDPMVLYTRFRGAAPSVEPLLERRGLN